MIDFEGNSVSAAIMEVLDVLLLKFEAQGLEYNTEDIDSLCRSVFFAARKHADQLDKQGRPYIHHPLAVMSRAEDFDQAHVAILHDVLEDTNATVEDLKWLGLSDLVIDAILALTRREGEVYIKDYIPRIAQNDLAKRVKFYDLEHNLSRIENLPPEEQSISKRYERALKILSGNNN